MASQQLTSLMQNLMELKNRTPEFVPTVERSRQWTDQTHHQGKMPTAIEVQKVTVGGVACEWLQPAKVTCTIIYCHGGGYFGGSLQTHRELAARFALSCNARVINVGYSLAPEHPYPAGLNDLVNVLTSLSEFDACMADNVFLAGDSAGGGLVLAALLKLKNAVAPVAIRGAVLLSPWIDLSLSGASMQHRAALDPVFSQKMLTEVASWYAPVDKLTDVYVSPLFGDLSGLPPILLQIGEAEVLFDDASRLRDKVEAVGGNIEMQVWKQALHGFQMLAFLPESKQALKSAGRFVEQHLTS